MPNRISISLLYQLLYLSCVAIPYLNIYEITFAVWTFTFLITIQKTYSIHILKITACFVAILAIAFVGCLFRNYPIYQIIRDITYLLKPIIGILVGYQLCKFDAQKAIKTIVYSGVFISIIHLIIITITFLKFHVLTVVLLRKFCGYFSDYEIYVLIILLFSSSFNLKLPKKKLYLLVFVVGVSSFLYLARTNMIQFAILFVGMKGYLKINKTSVYVLFSVVIALIIGYSSILYINPKRNGKGLEAFLYKIKIAPIEPFKTKINKDDWKDFNDNYRSFENITTTKQVVLDGVPAIIFGKGLGGTINLGQRVLSNDGTYVQQIAIVHNGYMTAFLKAGLFGVFFIFLSIYYISKTRISENEFIDNCNRLLIGSAFFLIISYFVFLGFYFKYDCKSIIIGFIISLLERERKLIKSNTN